MGEQKWTGTTFGNGWMHKWLIRILRIVDLRILYIFVALFIIPFCLLFCKSAKINFQYFRNRIGYNWIKSLWSTYTNHVLFGQVVIDKFAMYAGKKFDIEINGYEYFFNLASQPEGFVQLSSHIGNYEIAGYSLVTELKRLNALVFLGEKQTIKENRLKMFETTNINMIFVRPDMGHLFEIDEALTKGEIVSIPADRFLGSKKQIKAEFLNGIATFPTGPFSVATIRGVKVITVNVMKTKWNKYHIYVTPLDYDTNKPRKEQIQELSSGYIRELERILKLYPNQWYNFFEFWEK